MRKARGESKLERGGGVRGSGGRERRKANGVNHSLQVAL